MAVSKEQAQMITTLAIACRPHRAPTWDAPGVMAQIAKVAGLDLAEVAVASLRLARDPYAQTPAQIADTTAECWRESLKPPKWTPARLPPEAHCKTCGHSRPDCERNPHAGHDFEPDVFRPRDVDLSPVVAELKDHIRPPAPSTEETETDE